MKNNKKEALIKAKKQKWDEEKEEFLKNVPEKYSVSVEGLEDNSEYFHPIIKTEVGVVKGQCSLNNKGVYALRLKTEDVKYSVFIHSIEFSIENYSTLKDVLEQSEKYEGKLGTARSKIALLLPLKEKIDEVVYGLQENAIADVVKSYERKKSKRQLRLTLENLIMELEDNRLI